MEHPRWSRVRRNARRTFGVDHNRSSPIKGKRRNPRGPRGPRVNRMIRVSPIRVIGHEGDQIGIIETDEALRMANELGLDLVEVSPAARPPVCKIMDYGKHKYEQSKKQRKNRAMARTQELKQVRLGRSVKIDPHDVEIRVRQARKFLMQGNKVQITQRFRGREVVHKQIGLDRLSEIAESLGDISILEMPAKWAGRQASIILAPNADALKAAAEKDKERERKREKRRADAKAAKLQAAIDNEDIVPEDIDDDDLDDELDDDLDDDDFDDSSDDDSSDDDSDDDDSDDEDSDDEDSDGAGSNDDD